MLKWKLYYRYQSYMQKMKYISDNNKQKQNKNAFSISNMIDSDEMNNSPNKKKKEVKEVTDKVTNVNPDHLVQHIKTTFQSKIPTITRNACSKDNMHSQTNKT